MISRTMDNGYFKERDIINHDIIKEAYFKDSMRVELLWVKSHCKTQYVLVATRRDNPNPELWERFNSAMFILFQNEKPERECVPLMEKDLFLIMLQDTHIGEFVRSIRTSKSPVSAITINTQIVDYPAF